MTQLTPAKTFVEQGYVISTDDGNRIADIQEIQLNAIKYGMSLAANICKTHTNNACNAGFASQYDCEKSINEAAKTVTLPEA